MTNQSQYQELPNSGKLFNSKNKVHPKSPDMDGTIKIEKSLLVELMNEQQGNDVTIKLSAWRGNGPVAGEYLSLKVNTFKPNPNYAAAQQQHVAENTHKPVSDSDIPF
jgi:hypothetical protein